MPTTYELTVPGTQPGPGAEETDPAGLWKPGPAAAAGEEIAFGGPGADLAVPDFPVFRITLPGSPDQARSALRESRLRSAATRESLPAAEDRLRAALCQARTGADASFAVAAALPERPAADTELLNTLARIQAAESQPSFGIHSTAEAAFGLPFAGEIRQLLNDVQATLDRFRQQLAPYALVETRLGDRLVARSSVSWLGRLQTLAAAGITPEEADLHNHALFLVADTRATWVRWGSLILAAAVKLTVLFSTPLGWAQGLLAVLRYGRQVLDELRRHLPAPAR